MFQLGNRTDIWEQNPPVAHSAWSTNFTCSTPAYNHIPHRMYPARRNFTLRSMRMRSLLSSPRPSALYSPNRITWWPKNLHAHMCKQQIVARLQVITSIQPSVCSIWTHHERLAPSRIYIEPVAATYKFYSSCGASSDAVPPAVRLAFNICALKLDAVHWFCTQMRYMPQHDCKNKTCAYMSGKTVRKPNQRQISAIFWSKISACCMVTNKTSCIPVKKWTIMASSLIGHCYAILFVWCANIYAYTAKMTYMRPLRQH